jgi:hypothetical protein
MSPPTGQPKPTCEEQSSVNGVLADAAHVKYGRRDLGWHGVIAADH